MTAARTRSLNAAPPRRLERPGRSRPGRPGYDLDSLLAVAVEVFNERGYDGTSMEDLARRLGITKSAIYHHVSGKEELLRLATSRALDGWSAVAGQARALDAPAIERLEYLVRGGAAGRTPLRHAAAAGPRQYRGRAGGPEPPAGVRPAGRRSGEGSRAGRGHPRGRRSRDHCTAALRPGQLAGRVVPARRPQRRARAGRRGVRDCL